MDKDSEIIAKLHKAWLEMPVKKHRYYDIIVTLTDEERMLTIEELKANKAFWDRLTLPPENMSKS